MVKAKTNRQLFLVSKATYQLNPTMDKLVAKKYVCRKHKLTSTLNELA